MQNKRYFTDRSLKALAPAKAGSRYELWDTKIPGFGVRVGDATDPSRPGKAGQVGFILYTRFPGSPHPSRRALGRYGAITLEKAREKAAEWRELARKGIDPAVAEEEARQAALRQQDETFGALAEKFIDHIKANKERKADETARDLRQEFVKRWGSRPIASITAHDVAAVIDATLKRGKRARAHNLFGHVRRLFRWAVPLHLEHSPCALLSPERMIGNRAKRDRVLNDVELSALWRVSGRLGYPLGSLYRVLILTGLRLSEASEAKWSEIDLTKRLWIIPAERMKKTGKEAKPHLVPLTDGLVEIFTSLPRFDRGQFVFSYQLGKAPLRAAHFSKPKRRLDQRMLRTLQALARKHGDDPGAVTLPPWVNHDIRRTVRTNLSALKIAEEVREAVLAHARPGIKGHYDMHSYLDEKRDALEQWATRMRSIVQPPIADVVELRARR